MGTSSRFQNTLPISLLVKSKSVVVIGAGNISFRKTKYLLESGINVTVISKEFLKEFDNIESENLTLLKKSYNPNDLKGHDIAVAATNNPDCNSRIVEDGRILGVLVSAVDSSWKYGDYITPAVIRSGNVTMTISTGGDDFRKTKRLKEFLKNKLEEFEALEVTNE